MIPGKRFTLGDGKDYVVPPLTFRQMRELDEAGISRRAVEAADPRDRVGAMFQVIHTALVCNYPEVKLEDMEALLDIGLYGALSEAIWGKSRPEDRVSDPPGRQ